MIVHRVRTVDIDSGRIGKTWNEHFFLEKKSADYYLNKIVDECNQNEINRGRPEVQYLPDITEGIEGYYCLQYGTMICYDYITVK
jgi:hypothetical protein